MTLIAGLVTDTGIVFASDSEESGIYRKASVEKILSQNNPSGSSIVISGAGHGHLIDYTAQRILKEATPFGEDILEKPSWEVTAEEDFVKKFNQRANKLMLATLRTGSGINEKQFAEALTGFGTEMNDLRQAKKKSDEVIKQLLKKFREFREQQEKEKKEKEAAAAAAALEAAVKPPSTE